MRSLTLAARIYFGLILLAAFGGALSSFFTGKARDLPQWNGWSYLIFCVKEFAFFGAMMAFPIFILTLVVLTITLRNRNEQ